MCNEMCLKINTKPQHCGNAQNDRGEKVYVKRRFSKDAWVEKKTI